MLQTKDSIKLPQGTELNGVNLMHHTKDVSINLYVSYNGCVPNVLTKDIYIPSKKRRKCVNKINDAIGKSLDEMGVTYEMHCLSQIPQKFIHNEEVDGRQENDDILELDTDEYMDDESASCSLLSYVYTFKVGADDTVQILSLIDGWQMVACYSDIAKPIVSSVYKTFSEFEEEPEYSKKIMLVVKENYGFELEPMEINEPVDFNIDELYPDDFKPVCEGVEQFISNDKSGLIILHGLQGTGKTTYIRHLIYKFNKKFVFLPVELACELSSPAFISFVKNNIKGAILIIEDCETLLRDRSKAMVPSNGISNILNMSDGLLGDSIKLKFICTFNSKYSCF